MQKREPVMVSTANTTHEDYEPPKLEQFDKMRAVIRGAGGSRTFDFNFSGSGPSCDSSPGDYSDNSCGGLV